MVYHDGSATDTIIEVNLKHPGKQNRNITRNHRWAVYVNPVGQDAAVAPFNARCMAGNLSIYTKYVTIYFFLGIN